MPWFAWLFLALCLPFITWWLIDESRHKETTLLSVYCGPDTEHDDLDAIARTLPNYQDRRNDKPDPPVKPGWNAPRGGW